VNSSIETPWLWPWWYIMVFINVIQVTIGIHLYRQSLNQNDAQDAYVKWMRVMGLVFALVACYRAVFVSRYLYQYAWFDTVLNSSLLIRMFAMCAEMSFSGLIAFTMLRFNRDIPDESPSINVVARFFKTRAPYVLIACIFIAQFFATTGLITKSRLAFAIEESLWSVGFFAILPLAFIQARRIFVRQRDANMKNLSMLKGFAIINLGWGVIYCTYGLVYHLPTEYWAVAFEQLETGVPELKTGMGAVSDAFHLVNVTHNYKDWGFGFMLWHSAYFSVCVWIALFLMRAPRIREHS
jgi:hypothetical protein